VHRSLFFLLPFFVFYRYHSQNPGRGAPIVRLSLGALNDRRGNVKELASRLLMGATLVAVCTSVAAAGTLPITGGGLTLTGIVNSTFNFAGIDIRGTVALGTPDGTVLVTDSGASPAFGNLGLLAVDAPPNGTGAQLTFDLATFVLGSGGSPLFLDSTGITLVGPLSPAVNDLTSQILWEFDFSSAVPNFDGNGDAQVTYLLASAATPDAAPEPASISLGCLGLLALAAGLARRHRVSGGSSLT
jgi:hypothetical protein